MKKLSIEEKAYYSNYRSFNELIERLENVKNAIKEHNYGIAMDILCKPYPEFQITTSTELKESEDERIRKAVINIFNTHKDYEVYFGVSVGDIHVWLENQGKQKPIETNWKPSEEQMKALHDLNLTGNISYAGQGQALIDLYNSLKELT